MIFCLFGSFKSTLEIPMCINGIWNMLEFFILKSTCMGCKGSKVRILSHRPLDSLKAARYDYLAAFFIGKLGACPDFIDPGQKWAYSSHLQPFVD